MPTIAVPVTSRSAEVIVSLRKQKPVSSAPVIVPENARLNKVSLTITDLPTNFVFSLDTLTGTFHKLALCPSSTTILLSAAPLRM